MRRVRQVSGEDDFGLQSGRLIAFQQNPPHQLDRNRALPDELCVEFLKRIPRSVRPLVVFTQFVDLQLPRCVVEIRRIICAAPGLLVGVRGLLKSTFDEDSRAACSTVSFCVWSLIPEM